MRNIIRKVLKEEFNELDWIQNTVTSKLSGDEDWILVNDIDPKSLEESRQIQKYLFDLGYNWNTDDSKPLKDWYVYSIYHYGQLQGYNKGQIYYADGYDTAQIRMCRKNIASGEFMVYYWSDLKPKTIKEEKDFDWIDEPRNNPLDGLRLTTPMGRGGSGLTIKDDGGTHVIVTSSNGSSEYDRGTVKNFIRMGIWLPIDSMNESQDFDWVNDIKPTLSVAFEEGLIKKGDVLTLSGELVGFDGGESIQVSDFKIEIDEIRGPNATFPSVASSLFKPLQEKYFDHIGYDDFNVGEAMTFAYKDGELEVIDIS